MKFFFSIAALLFFSCSDEKPVPVSTPALPKSDTIVRNDNVNPLASVDLSPLDISYFPVDYPVGKMSGSLKELPIARVIYSRPHKQGRKIFGNLLQYGQKWRLGANEATEIEFFRNVSIQSKTVTKGRYILYCIPYADKWNIVFNSNIYSWGLHQDSTKDVHYFTIPVSKPPVNIEYFSMVFQESNEGANLVIGWDDVQASLPITLR
jgi:hypothetical protein